MARKRVLGWTRDGQVLVSGIQHKAIALVQGDAEIRVATENVAAVSPGGGFIAAGNGEKICLLDVSKRRLFTVPASALRWIRRRDPTDAFYHLSQDPRLELHNDGLIVRDDAGGERYRLTERVVDVALRGDGRFLATIGKEGFKVHDVEERAVLFGGRAPFASGIALGIDGTIALGRPIEGELWVAAHALPVCEDPASLDAETALLISKRRGVAWGAKNEKSEETREANRLIHQLAPDLNPKAVARARRVADQSPSSILPILLAMAAIEDDVGEFADAGRDLAEAIHYKGSVLRAGFGRDS